MLNIVVCAQKGHGHCYSAVAVAQIDWTRVWLTVINISIAILATSAIGAQAPLVSFTSEQADRGEALYLDECSRCHSETLGGSEFGPPVVGISFVATWKNRTAGELFELVRTTMPQDSPGRLSGAQSAEVLAFILRRNGFRPGASPLSSDLTALRETRIATE